MANLKVLFWLLPVETTTKSRLIQKHMHIHNMGTVIPSEASYTLSSKYI